ncbi:protein FAM192A [Herrania umbratica]|uniref:Protein FAM192A n=1 Tax=Herrania umbratica TaxID=108875 RepID=A0A6J0ZZ15_9ROSI|nr:protein FAM192A [Herrania umbratica]
MADESSSSIKLMNFVSEQQLDEAKRTRGERIEDGTAQRDRPLYEILKENKDKKDAEFNERFKHRPPKALDEDETEFLDNLETSRREYERQVADDEAEQLRSFQAAVAAQSNIVHELKEAPPVPAGQEQKSVGRKNPAARPLGMIIKVKPQAKKAKIDQEKELPNTMKAPNVDTLKTPNSVNTFNGDTDKAPDVVKTGLVSYSDESEDD